MKRKLKAQKAVLKCAPLSDKLLLVETPNESRHGLASAFQSSPSPNDPPWNIWAAMLVWVLSVLLIAILPSLVILAYVAPFRDKFTASESLVRFIQTDPTAVLLQIGAILPAHFLTLLISWAVVTRLKTYSFREMLGWKSGGMRWWHYLLILAAVFAISAVVTSYFPEADNDLLRIVRSSRAAVFMLAALATFTAPVVEEVVYRGVLYSALQRAFGAAGGVAIITSLFALVHFPQYWPSYSTLFVLTILSLTLALVRARTGNLLPAIILHTLFNGLQSALLIAEPYIR